MVLYRSNKTEPLAIAYRLSPETIRGTMNLATLRDYLNAKPGAVEDFPFGTAPLVLKVGGKMFALVAQESDPLTISLKCDPAHAQFLRDTFAAVRPGYHLNKDHWNTV